MGGHSTQQLEGNDVFAAENQQKLNVQVHEFVRAAYCPKAQQHTPPPLSKLEDIFSFLLKATSLTQTQARLKVTNNPNSVKSVNTDNTFASFYDRRSNCHSRGFQNVMHRLLEAAASLKVSG